MRLVTAEHHREISAQFLDHAEDEFRRGDRSKYQSEQGRGLPLLNAVMRGWPLGSHRRLSKMPTS